ncbi:MAG: response regulator RpfG family c-di-GMP phosphodiesterase, partial [Candidatus Latescibacterota bacterium]
ARGISSIFRAKAQQKPTATKGMNNTANELTVLLVDDEEMVRLAMSTALSHAGLSFSKAPRPAMP